MTRRFTMPVTPFTGSALARLRKSWVYDIAMRLPMLAWTVFLALVLMAELEQYCRTAGSGLRNASYALNIAMRLSMITYLVILAAMLVIRSPPKARARGVEPRVSAWLGTFLITVVVLFPRHDLSPAAGCISTLLVLAGDSIAAIVLIQLGGSFSVMAEARQLAVFGVYRFVRHPLYLAEEVATIGGVMQFLSTWTAILVIVQIICQFRRMKNEEAVLMEIFPEYSSYKEKTPLIVPGLY